MDQRGTGHVSYHDAAITGLSVGNRIGSEIISKKQLLDASFKSNSSVNVLRSCSDE